MRILDKDIGKDALVNVVNVYGAAHVRDKQDFLIELVHVFSSNVFPFVVGGDFNIIRKSSDCNKKKEVA
jgi:exonuclease III